MPKKIATTSFQRTFTALCMVVCILGSLNVFLFWMLHNRSSSQLAVASVKGINIDKPGYIRRFTTNTQGNLVFTGNTLMLSKKDNGNNGTGGVFVTTDTTMQVPTYPAGTTDDWRLSHTQFQLNLPPDAEVLHAEIIWGGNYNYYETNLEEYISKPIDFFTPSNTKAEITPDPITASRSDDGDKFYNYINSQNVTALVASSGSGTYGCGNIPAITKDFYNTNTYAGCTLAVAYRSDKEISRNLTIFVGHEVVNQNSGRDSTISEVSGFITPPSGTIDGSIFISAQEGDSLIPGDQFLFGRSENELTALEGNNNLKDNFFASQINDSQGNIDTSGLFGDSNLSVTDSQIIPGMRHGWDITTVPVGQTLQNNQRSAFAQGTSRGDGYIINALGIALEIKAPKFNPQLSGDIIGNGCIGEPLNYTMTIMNTGTGNSINTNARINVPSGTRLKQGSVRQNNQPVEVVNDTVALGTILAGSEIIELQYQLEVTNNVTVSTGIITQIIIEYEFENEELNEIIIGRNTSNILSSTLIPSSCTLPNPPSNPVPPIIPPVTPPVVPTVPPVTPPVVPVVPVVPIVPPVPQPPVEPTPNPEPTPVPPVPPVAPPTSQPPVEPTPTPTPTPPVTIPAPPTPTQNPNVIRPTNDIGSTEQGQPVLLDVTGNDGDNLDLSCLEVINGPAFGTTRIINGQIEYTPISDYVGLDQFTYRICTTDNTQYTPTVTVVIQINPSINGTKKEPEVKGVNENITLSRPTTTGNRNTSSNPINTTSTSNTVNRTSNASSSNNPVDNQLAVTGMFKLPFALLGIVFVLGTLSMIIPASLKDKKETEDKRRQF